MLLALVAALAVYFGESREFQPAPPLVRTFRLTDPRSGDCALWTAVEQWARQARQRVGFEATRRCDPHRKVLDPGEVAVTFEEMSPIGALDGLLQLSPEFVWSEINGVVVIRPKVAWADPDSALNQAIGQFSVPAAHPHFAVHAALEAARPSLLIPHTDLDAGFMRPRLAPAPASVAFQFEGGSLMDALNAIISGFDGVWQVGYTGQTFHVVLHTLEFQDGGTSIPGRLRSR